MKDCLKKGDIVDVLLLRGEEMNKAEILFTPGNVGECFVLRWNEKIHYVQNFEIIRESDKGL